MREKIILNIFTEYERVMYEWQKDATTFDGNESYPPVEGWKQKHPKNESEKVMQQTGPFCQNVIVSTQNDPQEFVWPPRVCIHASQHHKETTGGVLEDLLPDLDQDITELLDSLRRHLEGLDGLKNNVLEML